MRRPSPRRRSLIVVGVFLSIGRLGLFGALICSCASLSVALVAQIALKLAIRSESTAEA